MFSQETYVKRREELRKRLGSGMILLLGNDEAPMNCKANPYWFRQDSTFLYFFGLDSPGLAGMIDIDQGTDTLFGDDVEIEDMVWTGPQSLLKERADQVGVQQSAPLATMARILEEALEAKRSIHHLPPYRTENILKLHTLLGQPLAKIEANSSPKLIKAVVALRSKKSAEEIQEIEKATEVAYNMHVGAMKMVRPGIKERQIVGMMEGVVKAAGGRPSFPMIVTVNGETLHNPYHGNTLTEGKLLLADAGAESELHYASDITRTMPVSGRFSQKQKEIYEIVLQSHERAIQTIRPGVPFREIHRLAAEVLSSGLKELGLIKGEVQEMVHEGAHALFFPCGVGHMMGLDAHDMEDLGEDYVGYDDKTKRSKQFGLCHLRLARALEPGFVLTVEPGIYFIPQLIELWRQEKKFTQFINYDKLESYLDFGGARIEDGILVTPEGGRVLGRPIPKSVQDVEEVMA